jgi:hypothetical protein
MSGEDKREIPHALETPGRLATPGEKFKLTEVKSEIKKMRPKKAPGHDRITGMILKELPDVGILTINHSHT